jgi:TrmH family RNA methyltransferase
LFLFFFFFFFLKGIYSMFITSRENSVIKDYVKLAQNKKYRFETKRFVIEGARLVNDAFISGVNIESVFFEETAIEKHKELYNLLLEKNIKLYTINAILANKIADTQTTQGIFSIAFMLDKEILLDRIDIDGVYLALENIQEPGNLGTMLRTADAFGFNGVVLSEGCADIYSPKVLRSAMGAIFRMPFMVTANLTETIKKLTAKGIICLAAVADSSANDLLCEKSHAGAIAVIGNEGNGLSQNVINACSRKVTIRMRGQAESLNAAVAASVFMWELTRERA